MSGKGIDWDSKAKEKSAEPKQAPYNLLLVEKPDTSNGFSYGFGANGSAGIVVFSGFLDEILKTSPASASPTNVPFSFANHAPPTPTPGQTAQLAVLLAPGFNCATNA